MPCYNSANYLGDAINSVMDQTYPNWELIIIDDGSVDTSRMIIQNFTDNRIKYLYQKNKGVGAARNLGLSHAEGEFLLFLDADDVLTPSSIKSRLHLFENLEISFVDGIVEVHNEDYTQKLGTYIPSFRGKVARELYRLNGSCFFGISWMVRRNRELEYKFREDLTHGEDLEFYMRYSETGQYDYVNQDILLVRKHSTSAMQNLKGLAKGYSVLSEEVYKNKNLSLNDRIKFDLKRRKIMLCSFFDRGEFRSGVKYFLTGK